MKRTYYLVIITSILFVCACSNSQPQENEMVNHTAQNANQQQLAQTTQRQQTNDRPNNANATQKTVAASKPSKRPNTPNPNFKVTLDDDMKPYLNKKNKDTKLVSKTKFEANYFVNYINGIVKLTGDQKSSIRKLASENIQIKLDLQDQMQALKKAPNKDFMKIRTVARAIAFQHQEEVAYLEKELTPEQFKKYTAHQEKKMKR